VFPEEAALNMTIRKAVEDFLGQLKADDDSQITTEVVARACAPVTRAVKKFAVLDRELLEADSHGNHRMVRRKLNTESANMRMMLADYIRLALLHIRELKAVARAERCRRCALDISMRDTARSLNQLRAEMGNPPNWPQLPTDRDRKRDPLDEVDEKLLKMDRKAIYDPLWNALEQFALWVGRHVWGLIKTYAVEILIAVILLGPGISTLLGLIGPAWTRLGFGLSVTVALLRYLWLNWWLGDLFLSWQKRRLETSLSDFSDAAKWTYVFLALIDIKLDKQSSAAHRVGPSGTGAVIQ